MKKLKMKTLNKANDNFEKLATMFPNAITESIDENGETVRTIDKDILMQEVSTKVVDGREERYQFTWPDKKQAILAANTPTNKTLRPCRNESVCFDSTKNLYIEGDNLEVLKLLRETYLGKIKMVYIDPPYNTGNDFVYNDDFAVNSVEYLKNSGQIDNEGYRLVQNNESNGRFHTDWLNMIYPRLKVAKDLLTDDGVMLISIDDNEQENLKKICNEIFGESRFIGCFKWNRVAKAPSLSTMMRTKYEYVMAYFKTEKPRLFGKESYNKQAPLWHLPNKKKVLVFPKNSIRTRKSYEAGYYGGSYQVELLDSIEEENGTNKEQVRIVACSSWGQTKINQYCSAGNSFEIKKSPTTFYVDMNNESSYIAPSDLINYDECGVKRNTDANEEMRRLGIPFDYSKPVSLIRYLIKMVTFNDKNAMILDFFSGSSTTASAVIQENENDGGNRRFIMVQIPEETSPESEAYKAGFRNICDIGKERIRREAAKIKEENGLIAKDLDMGFRVLKCDSSNMKDVYYNPDQYNQDLFNSLSNNIKEDRKPEDLLFQVLLELGVLLSSKIEEIKICGKRVFNVDNGYLFACFDADISDDVVKAIAKKQPHYAVFRDSGMASDSVMTNFDQIFTSISPMTVRRVL